MLFSRESDRAREKI